LATVNNTSVREEFESLKGEFERLSSSGKISPESKALFKAMLTLFSILMAVFMEKTTKKTNKNSSKPSSQTDKDETTPPETGTKGKGPRQNDEITGNTRTVISIETLKVNDCANCGEDLTKTACDQLERRTKIDIIFEKTEEHFDAECKTCPTCGARNKAAFPSDLSGPIQYGMGIKAYMLNLLIAQMMSLNRIKKLMQAMISVVISEATILKYVLQLHQALEGWEKSSIEKLLQAPSLHVDETSLRVNKKNHWIHVCSAGNITLKIVHPKRGTEAIEDIGIIPRYGGVLIHDCWKSYLSYGNCRHGLCGSHLLRELTFIVESNNYVWAKNMKRLLKAICKVISKREDKKLTDQEYANLQKRYRCIITQGWNELPVIPPKASGKRGKVAKSDAHNLWERLQMYESSVLLFARETNVAFTNNRAEQDLRMSKVKQKVSGCFRKEEFAKAYCRISSYLQTMANEGFNPLIAIQMALSGKIIV
jgi:transposase